MKTEFDKTDLKLLESIPEFDEKAAFSCELLEDFLRHKANMKSSALAAGLIALQLHESPTWSAIRVSHASDISEFALNQIMLSAAAHIDRQSRSRVENARFGLLNSYRECSDILDAAEGFDPALEKTSQVTNSLPHQGDVEAARKLAVELLAAVRLDAETAKARYEKDVLRLEKRLQEEMATLEKQRAEQKSRVESLSQALFEVSDQLTNSVKLERHYTELFETEKKRTTARQPPTDLAELENDIARKRNYLDRFLKPDIKSSMEKLDRSKKLREKASRDLADVKRQLAEARGELVETTKMSELKGGSI